MVESTRPRTVTGQSRALELVAYLHTELARRYAGKAQPAIYRELERAEFRETT